MKNIFNSFPEFKLITFNLRQIEINKDYKNFYTYITHPQVKEFLSTKDVPLNLESSIKELTYWYKLFVEQSSIYWAITNKFDEIIGTCGFNLWDRTTNKIELSYDLSYYYWGKGIMSQVVKLLTEFAFEKMNILRIQATISVNNLSSMRVLEKNGFINEALLQNYGNINGIITDYYMFSKHKNLWL